MKLQSHGHVIVRESSFKERLYGGVELGGDFGFGGVEGEGDGLAYLDFDFATAEPACSLTYSRCLCFFFELAEAAEGYGEDGGAGLFD
jgi:hypothetical protein